MFFPIYIHTNQLNITDMNEIITYISNLAPETNVTDHLLIVTAAAVIICAICALLAFVSDKIEKKMSND